MSFNAAQKVSRLTALVGCEAQIDRRVVFRFCASPERLWGDDRVSGVRLVRNALIADASGIRAVPTDEFDELDCGLVIRSVGYRGKPVGSVPFDPARAIIPNRDGRVFDPAWGELVPGFYVSGWIKRGPSGVIGTNKHDAKQTVACPIEDFHAGALTEPHAELAKAGPDLLGA